MPDTTNLVAALYGAALSGSGQSGAQAAADTYVTLEWPGMPVEPGHYGNIWASDNQTGSAEALEAFSSLVDDDLPALAPLFSPAGISLPQVYSLILQANAPSGPLANAFTTAQQKFATVTRGSLEMPGVDFHPSWPAPAGWCDPGSDPLWTKVSIGANQLPPAPRLPVAWTAVLNNPALSHLNIATSTQPLQVPGVHPNNPPIYRMNTAMLRPATLQLPAAGTTTNVKLFQKVASAMITTAPNLGLARALAGKRGLLETAAPRAMPSAMHMMAPAARATSIAVEGVEAVAMPIHSPRFPDFPPDPIGIGIPHGHPTTTPVTTTQVGLTFDYIRVVIRRPWLETTLLRLPGWSIPGLPVGSISTGHTDTSTAMMPLIPIAFIAIRNVIVNGQWSPSDRQSLQTALTSGKAASLGPLTLSAGGGALGGFDGQKLTLPGVSIIAWICSVVPNAPPQ